MDQRKALSKREGWLLGKTVVHGFRHSDLFSGKLCLKSCNTHLFNPKGYFGPLQGKAFPRARPQAGYGIKRVADVGFQA
jgi:hypothetical protein